MSPPAIDVLLIGGGIMSAHVGTMLKRVDPRLSIELYEAAPELARESSDGWNNAGTGHAGLCELNYTPPPAVAGAPVDVARAVEIFARFEQSRHFWSYAVAHGLASRPAEFIRAVPHLSFVRGPAHVAFLRARHAALVQHPFFRAMDFTAERDVLRHWAPLLVDGRAAESIAATKIDAGTDVNFGELSRQLLTWLAAQDDCRVFTAHRVTHLRRAAAGWEITVRHTDSGESRPVRARFVFIGAGGGTLPLLQASGLPIARGLGAFPIAGQWLVCENPAVVARHFAKVYGPPPADSGALGGPHLDVRHLHGKRVLLFGPFATWTTKFLHHAGRRTDLAYSIRLDNLSTLLRTGGQNRVLVRFLVQQALQRLETRLRALREFYPQARPTDWRLIDAGIRVQALKKADAGRLNFGTEVVTAPDGTLAALLGASPGASVSANIASQIIQTCFPDRLRSADGYARMKAMLPTFDLELSQPAAIADNVRRSAQIDDLLGLRPPPDSSPSSRPSVIAASRTEFSVSVRMTRFETILTHPGGAHADEFLACSVLLALHAVPLVRREPTPHDLNDPSICVVDVGHRHEPGLHNFDHHQLPKDHPPTCALSLVLQHLGLYDDARQFCDWLETTEWFDTRGPVHTAKWLGISTDTLARLNSPVHTALLRRFALVARLDTGEPLWEMMRVIGEDIVDYIKSLRARLDFLARHAEFWTLELAGRPAQVLFLARTEPLPEEPGFGIDRFIQYRGLGNEVIAVISPDRRGTGYGLERYRDNPRLDFTRLEGQPGVHFTHARGFVAKTTVTEVPKLKALLARAAVDVA